MEEINSYLVIISLKIKLTIALKKRFKAELIANKNLNFCKLAYKKFSKLSTNYSVPELVPNIEYRICIFTEYLFMFVLLDKNL